VKVRHFGVGKFAVKRVNQLIALAFVAASEYKAVPFCGKCPRNFAPYRAGGSCDNYGHGVAVRIHF
jgi:hypothetical protein